MAAHPNLIYENKEKNYNLIDGSVLYQLIGQKPMIIKMIQRKTPGCVGKDITKLPK